MRVTLRACLAAALAALLAAACGSSSSSSSSAAPTAPSTGPGAPSPGGCRAFSTAGSFTLDGDVPCVSLESSNLTVDCNQHAVTDHIQYRVDSTNVMLRRCNLPSVNIQAVSGFTISQSTIVGMVNIAGSSRIVISDNTISAADESTASCCVIRIVGGSDNQLIRNVIDGRYHGQCSQCGADDGILIDNGAGDAISGNRIVNVWDEGVEGINAVATTAIADNTIVNAAFAGIGFVLVHALGGRHHNGQRHFAESEGDQRRLQPTRWRLCESGALSISPETPSRTISFAIRCGESAVGRRSSACWLTSSVVPLLPLLRETSLWQRPRCLWNRAATRNGLQRVGKHLWARRNRGLLMR